MFKATFAEPTAVETEAALRQCFRTDRIYLLPGSHAVFHGEIVLAAEVTLAGACAVAGSTIENGCILTNVKLGHKNIVRAYSVLSDLTAGNCNVFGPFCFIRDHCSVADGCILGAYVEATRSIFRNGVRISHRTFVGDADIGDLTTIGAGVVFCNFDGKGRRSTRIGPSVLVGSGSLLVAPLVINEGSIIGAGSTITRDINAGEKVIQRR